MFKTRITEMLGIEYPIICGGMQWLTTAELVAAVSNAGGMGILASGSFSSKEELRDELRKTRSLTDKPFGINVTFMPTLKEIDRGSLIDTAIEEGASAIETSGRITEADAQRVKKGNVKHIHKVARLRDAKTAERFGVDAVIIVGLECGGHPPMEDVTTFILVPRVVDAVSIPVLAGGGIGDARGFVAALSLGAEGVVMGTRFLVTRECWMHQNFKDAMLSAAETDTMCVLRSIKGMIRVLKNEVAEKVLALEDKGATLEELIPLISGQEERKGLEDGNLNAGLFACGQVTGLIDKEVSVKELIDSIINGAKDILNRLAISTGAR